MRCVAQYIDTVPVAVAKARLAVELAKARLAAFTQVAAKTAFSAIFWVLIEINTDVLACGEFCLARQFTIPVNT